MSGHRLSHIPEPAASGFDAETAAFLHSTLTYQTHSYLNHFWQLFVSAWEPTFQYDGADVRVSWSPSISKTHPYKGVLLHGRTVKSSSSWADSSSHSALTLSQVNRTNGKTSMRLGPGFLQDNSNRSLRKSPHAPERRSVSRPITKLLERRSLLKQRHVRKMNGRLAEMPQCVIWGF